MVSGEGIEIVSRRIVAGVVGRPLKKTGEKRNVEEGVEEVVGVEEGVEDPVAEAVTIVQMVVGIG
jgi:hypothetical protein